MSNDQVIFFAISLAIFCTSAIIGWRQIGRPSARIHNMTRDIATLFGLFCASILIGRAYYSRSALLVIIIASFSVALLSSWLRHRKSGLKIATLGRSSDPSKHDIGHVLDISRGDDPSSFDVILIPHDINLTRENTQALSRAAMSGVEIRYLAEYVEEEHGRVLVEHFHVDHLDNWAGTASFVIQKRIFDLFLAIALIPLAAPLFALACLAVYVTMGGPALFRQPRVGVGGKEFTIYKIRTMSPAAPSQSESATSEGDNRVTALGRIMRKFRIDEIPQIYNVLIGDMSFIGPRPEQPGLTEQYCQEIPAFNYRSMVRPGITGWAQVNAGYAADLESSHVKLSYDLYYLKKLSWVLDLQILYRTSAVLLTGHGAR